MRRTSFPPAHAQIPNLAPMVDVVMVILIFFMLGTSFVVMEGTLTTRLPSRVASAAAGVSIIPLIRVNLQHADQGCLIRVMEHELGGGNFATLHDFLSEKMNSGADPGSRILISASPDVRYQDVISAMDASLKAGFTRIQFAVGEGAAISPVPESK